MTLNERAAYLKGLSEGLTIDKNTAEGKLLLALVDLCTEMADEITRIDEDVEYVNDYCEELDEDLGAVEELLVEDDELFDDEDDLLDEDDEFYEIECPACGELIEFDPSIDPEELTCPACHKPIAVELPEETDGE